MYSFQKQVEIIALQKETERVGDGQTESLRF